MSILAQCESSRWSDFLNIGDNQIPSSISADQDFFIGKNKSVTLTLKNGTTTKVRDVVVLGELIIKSSDLSSDEKGKFIARDVIVVGTMKLNSINFTCRNQLIAGGMESFFEELRSLISSMK